MLLMGQRKNRSNTMTNQVPIPCTGCGLSRYNTPIIALTHCMPKSFGGSLGTYGSRTDQPGLIVDPKGTGSVDEVLACLERMVIPLNSCTTFTTQGVAVVEIEDDLHHGVKI